MVGSAVFRNFQSKGYTNLLGRNRQELELTDQMAVDSFFRRENPDIVIVAAARVGGILANNKNPYVFLMQNLQIQNNLIESALNFNVSKFIFLGSSCIYPKMAPQPIKEEYLLTGPLEPTNEWYAIAKIAGVKACQAAQKQYGKRFLSLMPTNLYGPNDNFDLETSHVLPAMLRKFHEAKLKDHSPVVLWGSGTPRREFLQVEDLAEAVYFATQSDLSEDLYNVGTGSDIALLELAKIIQEIVGHRGEIVWDVDKPDGTPRKLLDISRMEKEGWKSSVSLETGIKTTYKWFLRNEKHYRKVKI